MSALPEPLEQYDARLVRLMNRHGIRLLRVALAVTYIWFGALKLAGKSPVADLVGKMAFGVPKETFVWLLGLWEAAIGVALLFRVALRLTLVLFGLQVAGTFLVLIAHPRYAFRDNNPLLLTLTGEFIVKNLVLLAAGLAIGGTLRRRHD